MLADSFFCAKNMWNSVKKCHEVSENMKNVEKLFGKKEMQRKIRYDMFRRNRKRV